MGNLSPSVCIDAVFGDIDSAEAIRRVSQAGISWFEFWGWWDKELHAVLDAMRSTNTRVAACCTKFISLVDVAQREDYLQGLCQSIDVVKQLDCDRLISQVGNCQPGVSREKQHKSLVDGLREAAPMLEAAGICLLIEPLNVLVDHPGYYLVHSDEAFQVVDEVASDNVKVLFDIYHQQISEGQLIRNIVANIDKIGHFHAAGNPGRHELTLGEINYPEVFQAIRATSYDGFVGLEYWPTGDVLDGLAAATPWFVEP